MNNKKENSDNINFNDVFQKNEYISIYGHNGAGKTSLYKKILGDYFRFKNIIVDSVDENEKKLYKGGLITEDVYKLNNIHIDANNILFNKNSFFLDKDLRNDIKELSFSLIFKNIEQYFVTHNNKNIKAVDELSIKNQYFLLSNLNYDCELIKNLKENIKKFNDYNFICGNSTEFLNENYIHTNYMQILAFYIETFSSLLESSIDKFLSNIQYTIEYQKYLDIINKKISKIKDIFISFVNFLLQNTETLLFFIKINNINISIIDNHNYTSTESEVLVNNKIKDRVSKNNCMVEKFFEQSKKDIQLYISDFEVNLIRIYNSSIGCFIFDFEVKHTENYKSFNYLNNIANKAKIIEVNFLFLLINIYNLKETCSEYKLIIVDDCFDSLDISNYLNYLNVLKNSLKKTKIKLIQFTHIFEFYRNFNITFDLMHNQNCMLQILSENNIKILPIKKNYFIDYLLNNTNNDFYYKLIKNIALIPYKRHIREAYCAIYKNSLTEDIAYKDFTSLLHYKEEQDTIFKDYIKSDMIENFSNLYKYKNLIQSTYIEFLKELLNDEQYQHTVEYKILLIIYIRNYIEKKGLEILKDLNKASQKISKNQTNEIINLLNQNKEDIKKTYANIDVIINQMEVLNNLTKNFFHSIDLNDLFAINIDNIKEIFQSFKDLSDINNHIE